MCVFQYTKLYEKQDPKQMGISTQTYCLKKEKAKSRGEFFCWTESSDSSTNLLDHLTGCGRSQDKDRSMVGNIIH